MNIDHLPALPGVYAIKNIITGKTYVGSSLNMKRRVTDHRERLRKGTHASMHLVGSWGKYGEEAFTVEILEVFNVEWLLSREQHFIESLQASNPDFGYNTRIEAHSNIGLQHSEQAKALIAKASRERVRIPHDEITREMIREKLKDRKMPEEQKTRIKNTMKDRPSHLRKLTNEQVLQILYLLHETNTPGVEIARMLNTTENTVCDIKKGRIYKDIIAAYAAARQARFEHKKSRSEAIAL